MRPGVLLVRPHDQANPLEQALAEQGFSVFRQAVIETQRLDIGKEQWQQLKPQYDGIVVVSPAAAQYFNEHLADQQKPWPQGPYYCVGSGTAERLVPLSGQAATYPAPAHTADALMELPLLQRVENQQWLLITGSEGRPFIADTLRQRGARLHVFEAYERKPLRPDLHGPFSEWSEHVQIIVVTSQQQIALFHDALQSIPGAQAWLHECTWVVSSDRLKNSLAEYNIDSDHIVVAVNATRPALLKAVGKASQRAANPKESVAPAPSDKSKEKPMQQDTPETKQEHTKPADKRKSTARTGRSLTAFLTVILLLCVITLAAGGYWVWAQQEEYRQQTSAQIAELSERIAAADRAQEQFYGEASEQLNEQLNERFSQLQRQREQEAAELREASAQERRAMREEFEQQTNELERLKSDIDMANLRVSEDLYLIEARDLVLAAGRKLWLDFDRRTAVQLLQRAERLLADAEHSHLIPIRQQLHNDIEMLEGIEELDLESLAMRVSALRRQIRQLPSEPQSFGRDRASDDTAISSDFSEWRANLAKAWANFTDDFIKVQRSEELPPLQIGQEQRALLASQLELQLQIAQQALMQRQTINYQEALQQAAEWIDAYYDGDQQLVKRTLEELEKLAAHDLDPSYPTRLLSEAMLRDAVDELLEGAYP